MYVSAISTKFINRELLRVQYMYLSVWCCTHVHTYVRTYIDLCCHVSSCVYIKNRSHVITQVCVHTVEVRG